VAAIADENQSIPTIAMHHPPAREPRMQERDGREISMSAMAGWEIDREEGRAM
jgi:hypothetical protein